MLLVVPRSARLNGVDDAMQLYRAAVAFAVLFHSTNPLALFVPLSNMYRAYIDQRGIKRDAGLNQNTADSVGSMSICVRNYGHELPLDSRN